MRIGTLMVVSGPSGVGKGLLCKKLMERESNVFLSISMTTRAPRPGEREGMDYYYINSQDFEARVLSGQMLEHALVHGNYYGTPRAQVMAHLERGEDVILEIDVQGGLQVRQSFPDTVLVFVLPPDVKTLRARLEGRKTESPEVIERRLRNAMGEFSRIVEYDYAVVNDRVDEAVDQIQAILHASACRVETADIKQWRDLAK